MSYPVRLRMPDGQEIWARVAVADGPSDVGWRDDPTFTRLDDLADTVRAVAASVFGALAEVGPDQVKVEFGIELVLKSGRVVSVLTESAAKASVRVTLSWSDHFADAAASKDHDGDQE